MEVFAFPVSTLVPFRVAHPTPGQRPRTSAAGRGRDPGPASLPSRLHEHEPAWQPHGPPSFMGHSKEDRKENGHVKEYTEEPEKEEDMQRVMRNRASEEALVIQSQDEEALGRGLGQWQAGLVQNLTALFLC